MGLSENLMRVVEGSPDTRRRHYGVVIVLVIQLESLLANSRDSRHRWGEPRD